MDPCSRDERLPLTTMESSLHLGGSLTENNVFSIPPNHLLSPPYAHALYILFIILTHPRILCIKTTAIKDDGTDLTEITGNRNVNAGLVPDGLLDAD